MSDDKKGFTYACGACDYVVTGIETREELAKIASAHTPCPNLFEHPTKHDALKLMALNLQTPTVMQFYERYLMTHSQGETAEVLEQGIKNGLISIREALYFALLVGVQWNEKFEGVP